MKHVKRLVSMFYAQLYISVSSHAQLYLSVYLVTLPLYLGSDRSPGTSAFSSRYLTISATHSSTES